MRPATGYEHNRAEYEHNRAEESLG